jgi:quercetin dioxygenase-like cupin family protein
MAEKQLVKLDEVEGFQHAQDDYWFRPLLFGKRLFMYVAHVPPGGDIPADGHAEKEEFELALYMLEGSLEITYGEEKFEIAPEMVLLVPLGTPFGGKELRERDGKFRIDAFALSGDRIPRRATEEICGTCWRDKISSRDEGASRKEIGLNVQREDKQEKNRIF